VKKRPKLHLVGHDPTDVFDDFDQLRSDLAAPGQARKPLRETFARIPHDKAIELYGRKLSRHAWAVLFELDRAILKAGGQNPVHFWNGRLRAAGLNHHTRARALRELERLGVILVKRLGKGRSPWVFHTWYPRGQRWHPCQP
jgi:hypothetical protein